MFLCNGSHDLNAFIGAVFIQGWKVKSHSPRVIRCRFIRTEFARQVAPSQRTPNHKPKILIFDQWDNIPLQVPSCYGVVRLDRFKLFQTLQSGYTQCFHDLPRGHITEANVANLSCFDQIRQSSKGLLERRKWIKAMKLVQIDMVNLKTLKASIDFVENVRP